MSAKVNGAEDKLVMVTRTVFSQTTEELETIPVRPFITEPARVRIERRRTINAGNYESCGLSISIEMPCYREEIVSCYKGLTSEVEALLGEEVTKILDSLEGKVG